MPSETNTGANKRDNEKMDTWWWWNLASWYCNNCILILPTLSNLTVMRRKFKSLCYPRNQWLTWAKRTWSPWASRVNQAIFEKFKRAFSPRFWYYSNLGSFFYLLPKFQVIWASGSWDRRCWRKAVGGGAGTVNIFGAQRHIIIRTSGKRLFRLLLSDINGFCLWARAFFKPNGRAIRQDSKAASESYREQSPREQT